MIYDKRKLKRYDIFLIVEFKPLRSRGGFSIGITRDLSPDGFSLESQTIECQRGEILEFRLKHPESELTLVISGEVIWRNHSWYKYVVGIKFLSVTEEQNTIILQLMSAVRDQINFADLTRNNSEIIESTEKEIQPEAILGAVEIDNRVADKGARRPDHVSVIGAERCELTGTERTFITGEALGKNGAESAEKIKPARAKDDPGNGVKVALTEKRESTADPAQMIVDDKELAGTVHTDIMEEADAEHKKISAAQLKPGNGRKTADAPYLNKIINRSENSRKKKRWLYVPFAMVVTIIFVIALPMMIKKFNHASIDYLPVLTESTDNRDTGKDPDIPVSDTVHVSSQTLNEPSEPSSVQQNEAKAVIPPEKEKAVNLRQVSAGEDSISILPGKSIVMAGVKSQKGSDAPPPPAEIEKTIKKTPQMNNPNVSKTETEAGDKPLRNNSEKGRKIDLIAKIDETFNELREIQNEKPIKTEAVIETEKIPENKPLVMTEEKPVPLQVVKREETPAAAPIKEIERIPEVKEEASVREEIKDDINKGEPSVKSPELPNVVLLVKRDKPQSSLNNSLATPSLSTADLLKRWKHIGSTKSGVPLFVSPDNISYPNKNVVNVLVKASVNKKDFIDLLAINCSQVKLRILEERNGNNPVLSSYSHEWKDIIADSMILYNSACPEKK